MRLRDGSDVLRLRVPAPGLTRPRVSPRHALGRVRAEHEVDVPAVAGGASAVLRASPPVVPELSHLPPKLGL